MARPRKGTERDQRAKPTTQDVVDFGKYITVFAKEASADVPTGRRPVRSRARSNDRGMGPLATFHPMNLAAIVAVVLLAVISVFQIALALGAPLGYASWGGRHGGVLPTRLRIASGVAGVVIYPLIGLFVLASAGLINTDWMPGTGKAGMWVLAGLFTLGALANFASRSKVERYWGPVSLVIAICCGITATRI
jgi:hypothetical protein